MIDSIYGAKLKVGETSFWDVYRITREDGQETGRLFVGYGQGRTAEDAVADFIRLELGCLQEASRELQAGELEIVELKGGKNG